MHATLVLTLMVALNAPPALAHQKTASPEANAPNETLTRALADLDRPASTTAALNAAHAAYLKAQRDLAAYLQGRPSRRGAPRQAALRALLDPTTGTFVVVRGTLWLRPEHHERLARAARAVGDQRLAEAHQRAAEAALP